MSMIGNKTKKRTVKYGKLSKVYHTEELPKKEQLNTAKLIIQKNFHFDHAIRLKPAYYINEHWAGLGSRLTNISTSCKLSYKPRTVFAAG